MSVKRSDGDSKRNGDLCITESRRLGAVDVSGWYYFFLAGACAALGAALAVGFSFYGYFGLFHATILPFSYQSLEIIIGCKPRQSLACV